eukprot:TRINITY_DN24542_c0_g1_i1.p1 TRINITY_DN24542_c0_g1~~TRINITY_DN24542_c0_g1_i1.p1  ORF type:complete len:771 (+),score=171.98 TRINITY_DN24542_c0_g1_i1:89-2401(+)
MPGGIAKSLAVACTLFLVFLLSTHVGPAENRRGADADALYRAASAAAGDVQGWAAGLGGGSRSSLRGALAASEEASRRLGEALNASLSSTPEKAAGPAGDANPMEGMKIFLGGNASPHAEQLLVENEALRALLNQAVLVQATLKDQLVQCRQTNRSAIVEEEEEATLSIPLAWSMPIIVIMVLMSGLFSGLTLGLMGLDPLSLQIVANSDNKELAEYAQKITPVRESGNMLLCTLLLGNVAVNSALSILTAEIASGLVGFLVSTTLILLFGEILPQAICSRHALKVGARTVPIVKFLMALFYVVSKPISLGLDWLLGCEVGTVYSNTELLEMVKLQLSLGARDEDTGKLAVQVAEGAISFRDKTVNQVMTPLEDMYMLWEGARLGYETIREIFETGFSRVPVYGRDKNDYRGLLYTKDLMLADPEDQMSVGDFIAIFNRKVETLFAETKLVDALREFKKGGTHMGLVRRANLTVDTDPKFDVCGVITLEDIIEEILQDEIVDETDVYVDVDNHVLVADGRSTRHFNLGLFNPVWERHRERLSKEEVAAIANHLSCAVFHKGTPLELSCMAIEWLVKSCSAQNRARITPQGVHVAEAEDIVYLRGRNSDRCTLVLQGRLSLFVGHEAFRSEAGAFTLLGKDALSGDKVFIPDYTASISTPSVRLLTIPKAKFVEAQSLDKGSKEELEEALALLHAEFAGETSRQEAREMLRERMGDDVSPCSIDLESRGAPPLSRFSTSTGISPAITMREVSSPNSPRARAAGRKPTKDSL